MASWMRLDTRDVRSFEYDGLDVTAYGLLMLLAWSSWDHGGIPDDKAAILRSLRGRIDGAAFDAAWAQVRPLLDADVDGKLRIPWIEEARTELLEGRKNEAEKKRNQRLKARQSRLSPGTPQGVPGESPGSPRGVPVYGRTDGRTDETNKPQKRAPRAAAPPPEDPWVAVIEELVPLKDQGDWKAACALHAAARRRWKHKRLEAATWRVRVSEWLPHGVAAFSAAVQQSDAQGWQGLFPPKGANGARSNIPAGAVTMRDVLAGSPAPMKPLQPRDVRAEVRREP